jgi:hypothetical protein
MVALLGLVRAITPGRRTLLAVVAVPEPETLLLLFPLT